MYFFVSLSPFHSVLKYISRGMQGNDWPNDDNTKGLSD